jgi:hypothetical protein
MPSPQISPFLRDNGRKVSLKSSVKQMQIQGVMGKKELICDNNSMKKRILSLALAFSALFQLRADEGMWPLTLLQKIQDPMQARGLKLSAEDIYSINQASVKDAIVRLMTKQGRMFCTGEVSPNKDCFSRTTTVVTEPFKNFLPTKTTS